MNTEEWNSVIDKIWEDMGKGFVGVLATHDLSNVGARTMSIVIYDQKFYFQTDADSRKMAQLEGNGDAAIAYENYQILGKCTVVGHPMDLLNSNIFDAYKELYPKAASKYSGLRQERLVCFVPKIIEKWEYIEGRAQITIYDFEKHKSIITVLEY